MNRPTIDNLIQWLNDPLTEALGDQYGKLKVSFLSQATTVVDGTTVLLIRGSKNRRRGVVLCSPPASPEMVHRSMDRAHQAKVILGSRTGIPILDPMVQGSVNGLSYAVLPYCNRLSEFRLAWWIQRALMSPSIFDWLLYATECTVHSVQPNAIDRSFSEPLRFMASLKLLNGRLRSAATLATERLNAGTWTPRHVLMHGDFWKGNILIRPQDYVTRRLKLSDRLVIIDWAGSEIDGYAIYDLVRMAQSMRLNTRGLRREVERHCRLLQCDPADAMSYLLTALGHIAMSLDHFPIDRYAHMADSCIGTLERTLDSPYN